MNQQLMKIDVEKLEIGMILGQTIYDVHGNILLSKGVDLRESYIRKLKKHGISNVEIVFKIEENIFLGNKDLTSENIIATRLEAKKLIKDTMERLVHIQHIDNIEEIIKMVNKIIQELFQNGEISVNLTSLRSLDDYTFEHSVNVCVLSLLMGMKMEYSLDELRDLGIGAILHDIGKIFIPPEILNKPCQLTEDEFKIIKKHTIYGYDILKRNNEISKIAADIVLSHHERADGGGYPNAKTTEKIHIFSKIVALADVFDALTSDRVYKRKTDIYTALEYLINMSDIQFDKEIVYRFIYLIGIYPMGSIVKLNTKEVGVVVKTNKTKPQSPVIKILLDDKGKRVRNHLEVDIQKNPSIFIADYLPYHKIL